MLSENSTQFQFWVEEHGDKEEGRLYIKDLLVFVLLSLSVFFQVCGFWAMRGQISAFPLALEESFTSVIAQLSLRFFFPQPPSGPRVRTLPSHFPHHLLLLTFSHGCGHCRGSSLPLGVHRPFSLRLSAVQMPLRIGSAGPSCLWASKLEVPFACLTHGFGCPSSLGVLPLSKTKHTVTPPPPACVIPVSR